MNQLPSYRLNTFLENVERTPEAPPIAPEYVRLDRNEHVGPYSESVVADLLQRVTPGVVSDYPNPWHLYKRLVDTLDVPLQNLLLVPGSDAAIRALAHILVTAGDRVGMLEPSYAMYSVYTRMFGGEAVPVPMDPATLAPSQSALDEAIASVKVFFLANPNQPTSVLLPSVDVLDMARRAAEHDTVLVVDEAYFPFSGSTVLEHVMDHTHLVVLRTFSKAYGLAGLRIGLVVGPEPVIQAMYKVRHSYDINSFAILWAEYLLDHEELMDEFVTQVHQSALLLQQIAHKHGMEAPPTTTNFQLIKTAPAADPARVAGKLRDRGFVIRGPVGRGVLGSYIRVTLGYLDVMQRFAAELDAVLTAARSTSRVERTTPHG